MDQEYQEQQKFKEYKMVYQEEQNVQDNKQFSKQKRFIIPRLDLQQESLLSQQQQEYFSSNLQKGNQLQGSQISQGGGQGIGSSLQGNESVQNSNREFVIDYPSTYYSSNQFNIGGNSSIIESSLHNFQKASLQKLIEEVEDQNIFEKTNLNSIKIDQIEGDYFSRENFFQKQFNYQIQQNQFQAKENQNLFKIEKFQEDDLYDYRAFQLPQENSNFSKVNNKEKEEKGVSMNYQNESKIKENEIGTNKLTEFDQMDVEINKYLSQKKAINNSTPSTSIKKSEEEISQISLNQNQNQIQNQIQNQNQIGQNTSQINQNFYPNNNNLINNNIQQKIQITFSQENSFQPNYNELKPKNQIQINTEEINKRILQNQQGNPKQPNFVNQQTLKDITQIDFQKEYQISENSNQQPKLLQPGLTYSNFYQSQQSPKNMSLIQTQQFQNSQDKQLTDSFQSYNQIQSQSQLTQQNSIQSQKLDSFQQKNNKIVQLQLYQPLNKETQNLLNQLGVVLKIEGNENQTEQDSNQSRSVEQDSKQREDQNETGREKTNQNKILQNLAQINTHSFNNNKKKQNQSPNSIRSPNYLYNNQNSQNKNKQICNSSERNNSNKNNSRGSSPQGFITYRPKTEQQQFLLYSQENKKVTKKQIPPKSFNKSTASINQNLKNLTSSYQLNESEVLQKQSQFSKQTNSIFLSHDRPLASQQKVVQINQPKREQNQKQINQNQQSENLKKFSNDNIFNSRQENENFFLSKQENENIFNSGHENDIYFNSKQEFENENNLFNSKQENESLLGKLIQESNSLNESLTEEFQISNMSPRNQQKNTQMGGKKQVFDLQINLMQKDQGQLGYNDNHYNQNRPNTCRNQTNIQIKKILIQDLKPSLPNSADKNKNSIKSNPNMHSFLNNPIKKTKQIKKEQDEQHLILEPHNQQQIFLQQNGARQNSLSNRNQSEPKICSLDLKKQVQFQQSQNQINQNEAFKNNFQLFQQNYTKPSIESFNFQNNSNQNNNSGSNTNRNAFLARKNYSYFNDKGSSSLSKYFNGNNLNSQQTQPQHQQSSSPNNKNKFFNKKNSQYTPSNYSTQSNFFLNNQNLDNNYNLQKSKEPQSIYSSQNNNNICKKQSRSSLEKNSKNISNIQKYEYQRINNQVTSTNNHNQNIKPFYLNQFPPKN